MGRISRSNLMVVGVSARAPAPLAKMITKPNERETRTRFIGHCPLSAFDSHGSNYTSALCQSQEFLWPLQYPGYGHSEPSFRLHHRRLRCRGRQGGLARATHESTAAGSKHSFAQGRTCNLFTSYM